jgi:prolyl oligopeptidase
MDDMDTIAGVEVSDPFRWLEDDADPKVAEWQAQADTRAAKALTASPHAQKVAAAVRRTFADLFTATAPVRFGQTWFRTTLPEGRANGVVEVSSSRSGPGRVLFDPSEDDPNATLAGQIPSPDGRLLYVGTSIDGSYRYRVIDARDGTVVLDLGSFTWPPGFVWAGDSRGFYLNTVEVAAR